ncbi:hypothetical protein E4U52_004835 [Claviceps spartinae]|nr:hypothetical protein E4U52_004835 [Claviceps spartinae]
MVSVSEAAGSMEGSQHRRLHYPQNPVTSFCAFSAGYLNIYILKCPRVNLGRSPDAKERLETCVEYLEKYRHV